MIKLLPKLSTDLTHEDIPEHVQLLVTETFDAGLLGILILLKIKTILNWLSFYYYLFVKLYNFNRLTLYSGNY